MTPRRSSISARRHLLGPCAVAALYAIISGYTGCQDRQFNGTKYNGTGDKTLRFSGRTDTEDALVRVQMLRDPTREPNDTSSNWTTLTTVRGSDTALTWNDPYPYYDWTTRDLTLSHGTAWPLGGVLRVRTQLDTPDGWVSLFTFDNDYSECQQENSSESWVTIGSQCMTRYPRTGVTHIVSTANNPAADPDFGPVYLNRKLSAFDATNLGQGYYERLRIEVPGDASHTSEMLTLSEFKLRYGFNDRYDTTAYYYNRGDLGLGREMHCTEFDNSNGEGVACYVTNYRGITASNQPWGGTEPGLEQPAVNDAIARRNPLATVAMAFMRGRSEPVIFVVYNGRGNLRADLTEAEEALLYEASLELHFTVDSRQLPSNCTTCHGGSVSVGIDDPVRRGNIVIGQPYGSGPLTNVYFLPFDLQAFRFSSSSAAHSRANQEETFRKLNALVLKTNVTSRIRNLINGWYGGDVNVAGRKFNDDYIPSGWRNTGEVPFAEHLYEKVFEPYCQGCHMTQSAWSFSTAAAFVNAKPYILNAVCGNLEAHDADARNHRMPHAEATLFRFWNSGARAHLMAALDARGACN